MPTDEASHAASSLTHFQQGLRRVALTEFLLMEHNVRANRIWASKYSHLNLFFHGYMSAYNANIADYSITPEGLALIKGDNHGNEESSSNS
jgi:hypothetical protein